MSFDRIPTTYVGSLPRPTELMDVLRSREVGNSEKAGSYESILKKSVADIVDWQKKLGLDIVADGEFGKSGFIGYINDRLSGFEVQNVARKSSFVGSREALSFPEYYDRLTAESQKPGGGLKRPRTVCTSAITYKGFDQLNRDIGNLRSALKAANLKDAFIPSIGPATIEFTQPNEHYQTAEEYLIAISDALHEEYKAIVDAGFSVQVDDPLLLTYYITQPQLTLEECRRWAFMRAEALNHALRGIPEDRVRFHTCYSINMGPRVHDMELKDFADIMLSINAGGYSYEAGNPRHDHEWRVWEEVKLPDDKVLIPGVITNSTILVEHPELVAERLVKFAGVVGRSRVIAGADCGFCSTAGSDEIHPSIVWAKFESLVEGSRLASRRLWAKAA